MFPVSRTIDRYDTTFDHDGLIANAGLIVLATLMSRLGLERLVNTWVRTGSFAPGRKVCTLIAAMLAGATHRRCAFWWSSLLCSRRFCWSLAVMTPGGPAQGTKPVASARSCGSRSGIGAPA